MSEIELKLTTQRALEFEDRTGKDILLLMREVGESGTIRIRDVVELFKSLGDGYTADDFDAWNIPYAEKSVAVINAVNDYLQGKK